MAKKNKNKNNEKVNNIRDSLDSLINDDDIDLGPNNNLPPVNNLIQHDYVDIKTKAELKAQKTLHQMLRFYLNENIIENEEYVTANLRLKEMELTQLIFLMETGERAITTLLSQIDSGELSPRMFEVLATLQKSQLDMIKSQTLYVMATEEATKKLSRDLEVYSDINKEQKKLKSSDDDEDTQVFRGTKGLMCEIQDEIKEADTIEIEESDYGDAGKSGYDDSIEEGSNNGYEDDIEE
jgi:hypothetical protein